MRKIIQLNNFKCFVYTYENDNDIATSTLCCLLDNSKVNVPRNFCVPVKEQMNLWIMENSFFFFSLNS